jgi:glycerophosphoryl diester phosphodiesterase
MGARAMEFDVHQTLDGELIVAHDEDLRRCAGGDRRRIQALRWKGELALVDVGSWFDPRFKAERMPRLEDVFSSAPAGVELHLELKRGSSIYPGIEARVIDFLRRRRALKRTVVSSFDHPALGRMRALGKDVRLGYLLGRTRLTQALSEIKELAAESLHVSARQANARVIQALHRRNLKIFVYTVNTPLERDRLAAMGVDGIFSNYPELDLWR